MHATSSVLKRPFIEAGGDDRIERLDDAGTGCQGRHGLARALGGARAFGLLDWRDSAMSLRASRSIPLYAATSPRRGPPVQSAEQPLPGGK